MRVRPVERGGCPGIGGGDEGFMETNLRERS
jgi:hypothetical protein